MSDDLEKRYCTKNNFAVRFSDSLGSDPSMLLGYLHALDSIMPDLKKRIESAQNFDDLKKELLNAVDQHIETRDFIDDEWDNNADKYGLPERPEPPSWL